MNMQDTFQWTDETVSEFIMDRFVRFSDEFMKLHIDEFKQSKSPKKEWEIVEVREANGEILKYEEYNTGYVERQLPKGFISIHSVRRLSDQEIFSVGDRIQGHVAPIERIEINPTWDGHVALMCNNTDGDSLFLATKLPAAILTTVDGVEIFEDHRELLSLVYPNFGFDFNSSAGRALHQRQSWGAKVFSTREAAEQYITENKPVLSLNDVREVYGSKHFAGRDWVLDELTAMVKQKLNQ